MNKQPVGKKQYYNLEYVTRLGHYSGKRKKLKLNVNFVSKLKIN